MHISDKGEKCASIQIITANRSWYLEYPASSFYASRDVLDIVLAGNSFSESGLCIHIEQNDIFLHGNISFGAFTCLNSDIMGPFRIFAGMECSHSVISMAHALEGKLVLGDRILDFSGGFGYIEGDRGKSFPSSYLWTQCMWEDCSLMLAIADIPIAKLHFTGCICSIKLDGREYRLATYRGAKVLDFSGKGACLHQGRYRFYVELLDQNSQELRAPKAGKMQRTVHESVVASVRYRLSKDGKLLLDRISSVAGFEYSG